MIGNKIGESPAMSVNDWDDRTLQGEKANENEVNRTRDVSQWKLKRDIGLISKENPFQNIILKVW